MHVFTLCLLSAVSGRDSSPLLPLDLGFQRKCHLQSLVLPVPGRVLLCPPATWWQQSSSTTPLGPGLAGSPILNSYLEWVLSQV